MNRHIHFIGIGGIGMSGIASIFLRKGDMVSGSDLKENQNTQRLRALGARIAIGHDSANIDNPDIVVYSSAIREDNPEITEARKRNIPLLKRAQALAELMQDKIGIAVTGAHGKTTTTSLISHLLIKASLSPTVAIGGILRNLADNACLGDSPYFVAEADESDGSFLYYSPTYSVVTNIDYEHLDYYQNWPNIIAAYKEFIQKTKQQGCVFACGDDFRLRDILKGFENKFVLFGMSENNDIYPQHINMDGFSSEFDCIYKNKPLGRLTTKLVGRHNISNVLACVAIGLEMKINLEDIKESLASYQGSERRFQVKLKTDELTIIDDYAHHPTEIRATLQAARGAHQGRIIAVFQPHRYSRTKFLLEEFGRSFDLADYLILTDIYAASEQPIAGISPISILEKIKFDRTRERLFLPKENIIEHLLKIVRPGDMIITLGAGDINRICDELTRSMQMAYK